MAGSPAENSPGAVPTRTTPVTRNWRSLGTALPLTIVVGRLLVVVSSPVISTCRPVALRVTTILGSGSLFGVIVLLFFGVAG